MIHAVNLIDGVAKAMKEADMWLHGRRRQVPMSEMTHVCAQKI
jgi:hypothetical protein